MERRERESDGTSRLACPLPKRSTSISVSAVSPNKINGRITRSLICCCVQRAAALSEEGRSGIECQSMMRRAKEVAIDDPLAQGIVADRFASRPQARPGRHPIL